MTPKEKAEELVRKMQQFYFSDMYGSHMVKYEEAKQCALICVEEIIKNQNHLSNFIDWEIDEQHEYWQQVKQDIEKL